MNYIYTYCKDDEFGDYKAGVFKKSNMSCEVLNGTVKDFEYYVPVSVFTASSISNIQSKVNDLKIEFGVSQIPLRTNLSYLVENFK